MSVYRRGEVWWYKFYFANTQIRESAKTTSKTLAKEAEKNRRRALEEGYSGITKEDRNERIQTLSEAAKRYEADYKMRHPRSYQRFLKYCVEHLTKHLGEKILIEITERVVQDYQSARLEERASGKTINEEVGVLFRIVGRLGDLIRLKLQKAKKLKLKEREECGRALTAEEETRLLTEAKKAKSPAIYPAIVLALNTCMRDSEMRHLTWRQIDLFEKILTVGQSKTRAGTGRTIPINSALVNMLAVYKDWYETKVGSASPEHFVFPWAKSRHYDPKRPMRTFKTAWYNVRTKAKVTARLHDLRHTAITKLAESGAADETIMAIAGHVSRAMLSRYAHIRTEAKRRALEAIATTSQQAAPSALEPSPFPESNGAAKEHATVN